MRRHVTQKAVAHLCGVHQATVSRILNNGGGKLFSPETVERVFRVAREAGYLHPALLRAERRDSPRCPLSASVHVRFVTLGGRSCGEGTAEVENASMSGMLLRAIRTGTNVLPLEPFCVELETRGGRLDGFRVRGRPVRLDEEAGRLTMAVRYEALSDECRQILKGSLSSASRAESLSLVT